MYNQPSQESPYMGASRSYPDIYGKGAIGAQSYQHQQEQYG